MKELTIVLPVYNVEKYVSSCLDSVFLAKLPISYEILIVLGKSSDQSTEICRTYALEHPEIKLIVQEGKGLSNARNLGLAAAEGEYITFIDSDDFVLPSVFCQAVLENQQKKAEVSLFNYSAVFSETKLYRRYEDIQKNAFGAEGLSQVFCKFRCFWNTWRNIYERRFLLENNLFFKEGYLSEDLDHTTRVILHASRFYCSSLNYYNYRIARDNSLMNLVTIKRLQDTSEVLCSSISAAKSSTFPLKQELMDNYIFEWVLVSSLAYELPIEQRKEAMALFNTTKYILKDGKAVRLRLARSFVCVFGIRTLAYLLEQIRKFRRFQKKMRKTGRN